LSLSKQKNGSHIQACFLRGNSTHGLDFKTASKPRGVSSTNRRIC
jgi:hypothetical protein